MNYFKKRENEKHRINPKNPLTRKQDIYKIPTNPKATHQIA